MFFDILHIEKPIQNIGIMESFLGFLMFFMVINNIPWIGLITTHY